MINLKRLGAAATFALVLGMTVLAGETNSPPCEPVPGEVPIMPCPTQAMVDDSVAPGEIPTPPATDSVDIMLLVEIGLGSVLIF